MLNLTHAIDRASGYVYVPSADAKQPEGTISTPNADAAARPNAYGLASSAAGKLVGTRSDVRDVQERWIDAREEWDEFEREGWKREGQAARRAADAVMKEKEAQDARTSTGGIRERKTVRR